MRFKTLLGPSCFRVWMVIRPILFALYLLLMTTFSFFSMFEIFPNLLNLVNLQKIRYYAQRAEYSSDPTLVFVPRLSERVLSAAEWRGDGYSPDYGVEVPPIRYHASYTRDSFRKK